MANTFNVIIKNTKRPTVLTNPATKKKYVGSDTTDMVVQYRDEEHAAIDAKRLASTLVANPSATVEIRPTSLSDAKKGETMPLGDWVRKASAYKPPLVVKTETVVLSEIDQILAETAVVPTVAQVVKPVTAEVEKPVTASVAK